MTQLYKVLGYMGAIPFLMAALGVLAFDSYGDMGKAAIALHLIYAGLISAFLSGVHWAHSFPRSSEGQMILSMIPTIISLVIICGALMVLFGGFLSAFPSKSILTLFFILYAVLYSAIYILDWQHLEHDKFPDGYIKFRLKITSLVCLSFVISILAIWM